MDRVEYVYKPVGVTPLETLRAYRREFYISDRIKLGYAGRLDPMASGVLPVLVGEANNRRTTYEQLSKSYEFSVVFGVATDSYDLLGKVVGVNPRRVLRARVVSELQHMLGVWRQKYPPYSAARVRGKPLYWWARRGRLSEIEVPSKKIQIDTVTVLSSKNVSGAELGRDALSRTRLVRGDFRQGEILAQWSEFVDTYAQKSFPLFLISVSCSSGVYVRGIAHMLGQRTRIGALASTITRTRVGDVHLSSCVRLGSIVPDG